MRLAARQPDVFQHAGIHFDQVMPAFDGSQNAAQKAHPAILARDARRGAVGGRVARGLAELRGHGVGLSSSSGFSDTGMLDPPSE
jgi:hypothetical protein